MREVVLALLLWFLTIHYDPPLTGMAHLHDPPVSNISILHSHGISSPTRIMTIPLCWWQSFCFHSYHIDKQPMNLETLAESSQWYLEQYVMSEYKL